MRINSKKQLRNICQSVTDLRDSSARAPPGGIFMKFDIWDLYENFLENLILGTYARIFVKVDIRDLCENFRES